MTIQRKFHTHSHLKEFDRSRECHWTRDTIAKTITKNIEKPMKDIVSGWPGNAAKNLKEISVE